MQSSMRAESMAVVLALLCACPREATTTAPSTSLAATPMQRVQTDGFELSVPQGWRVEHNALGIEAHPPGDAIELVVSGAYPASDAETTREIVSAQGGIELAAWTEHPVTAGRLMSTSIIGTTRLDVYIVVGDTGHVVVTTESSPTRDDSTTQLLGDIVASVRVGKVAVERRCKASILETAETHGTACMDAAQLGDDMVRACADDLQARGWTRDTPAEQALSASVGAALECYRRGAAP